MPLPLPLPFPQPPPIGLRPRLEGAADDPEPGADSLLLLDTCIDEPVVRAFSVDNDTAVLDLEPLADSSLERAL